MVEYYDGWLSSALKGDTVELEDGTTAQDGKAEPGMSCIAPWRKDFCEAKSCSLLVSINMALSGFWLKAGHQL